MFSRLILVSLCLLFLPSEIISEDTKPDPKPKPTVTPSVNPIPKPPSPDSETEIRFPEIPTYPHPDPPSSDSVPILSKDQTYVVESNTQFFLLASPEGLVKIEISEGPLKIRSKFPDGSGKLETRIYKSNFVATVEVEGDSKGRIELIAVPYGITDAKSFVRRMVDIGIAPQPPPDPIPIPPPGPGPDPKPPGPTPIPAPTGFRVIIAWESSAKHTKEQLNIINSTKIVSYLDSHCVKNPALGTAEWRRWDVDTPINPAKESKTMMELWNAVKDKLDNLPHIVIVTKDNAEIHDLPATEQETLDLLKKYGGQ